MLRSTFVPGRVVDAAGHLDAVDGGAEPAHVLQEEAARLGVAPQPEVLARDVARGLELEVAPVRGTAPADDDLVLGHLEAMVAGRVLVVQPRQDVAGGPAGACAVPGVSGVSASSTRAPASPRRVTMRRVGVPAPRPDSAG
jgi:hypothetical protein